MDLLDLRARLQDITYSSDIDGHLSAIEALKSEFLHTIRFIGSANPALLQNCFEWALGISQELAHWVGELELTDLCACSKFVQELIPHLIPVSESDAAEGDLVLYFDGQMPTHAGLVKTSTVISKWGKGHIYQHGQLEVPSSYGNEISFYRKLPAGVATTRFVEYVRNHPDYDAIKELFEEELRKLKPQLSLEGPIGRIS